MELEEIMEKLEKTVNKMENEKLTLEESFKCFSDGMKYVKDGNEAIDRVEKKIKNLMEEEVEEEDYE